MYEIQFTEKAQKQLAKLERSDQERIVSVLERARIRPEAHFTKLVGESAYRLRVGDYRVIADIDHGKLLILVIKVSHRKHVYDSS